MNSTTKVIQVFNNNPQGSWLRGRPKKQIVELCTNRFSINAKLHIGQRGQKRNRADMVKSIKEAKVQIGL
jgi:hypothetical protein